MILSETKVFRDPIHSYIHVEDSVIAELIDTKEFQRLRRIHQLGGTFMVFHAAEHSRFGHSLGVYEIVRRMVSEVKDIDNALNEYEKITVMCAALLHDLGHGPFSHAFEAVSGANHEEMTIKIILETSEVNKVLSKYDKNLPHDVACVINHTHTKTLLTQLVSSQLDADRMDYLLRDSYYTGTTYGEFDLERILRTLKVVDEQLVVKETGVHTIEDYIMARYHMYWQVYFHPTSRSFEAILVKLFKRIKEVETAKNYPMFKGLFAGDKISVADHYILDESACYYGINLLREHSDKILSDLSRRILERDLFEYIDIDKSDSITDHLGLAQGDDPDYYLYIDSAKQLPYSPYNPNEENLIKIYTKEKEIVELSDISNIVSAITKGKNKEDFKLYYPQN
ncbi:MAG: HD domain-containing protein [Erysipelotrichaceae bacterium]